MGCTVHAGDIMPGLPLHNFAIQHDKSHLLSYIVFDPNWHLLCTGQMSCADIHWFYADRLRSDMINPRRTLTMHRGWNNVRPNHREWISNFIPYVPGHVITYPCWDYSHSMIVNVAPGNFVLQPILGPSITWVQSIQLWADEYTGDMYENKQVRWWMEDKLWVICKQVL